MKKLTKYIVCLAALLVLVASTMGSVDKATGGGWFYDYHTGNKCTFGFDAQYKDNPGAVENEKVYTGQLHFKDHGTGEEFHLKEMTYFYPDDVFPYVASFGGYDKDGKYVHGYCVDYDKLGEGYPSDYISLYHQGLDKVWTNHLEGGNIVAHQED